MGNGLKTKGKVVLKTKATHWICWAFCFPALKPGDRSELELLKPNERVQQRKQKPCWLRAPTCRCAVPRDCGGL